MIIRVHAIILVMCSTIGFTGHYLQFGVARLTPWIPAVIGLFVMFLDTRFKNRNGYVKHLPLVPVLIFGVITTIMCIRFLPQEFQPLRKKIVFSVMSLSAWITLVYSARSVLKAKWKQRGHQRDV